MAEVPLVDLEVIVRYSLAIRQELAPAEEVLAALDESRALVLSLLEGRAANGDGEEGGDDEDDEDEEAKASPMAALSGDVEVVDDEEIQAEDAGAGVTAAEDRMALDDLAGSGGDVVATPARDPEPAPARRAPPPPADVEPDEPDQAWVDEVERIRQRRIRKARQEAEERQARQAELARQAERAKRERREAAARHAEEPELAAPPARKAGTRVVDDALELPPPLPADEAARRRAERRRRRGEG